MYKVTFDSSRVTVQENNVVVFYGSYPQAQEWAQVKAPLSNPLLKKLMV